MSTSLRFSRNEPYLGGACSRLSRNLKALLEARRLSTAELAARSDLDETIIRALVRGEITRPSLTTLDPLAAALEIDVAELLAEPADDRRRAVARIDRRTNPLVAEVIAARPQLFAGWTPADYEDLYSRFGTGGELSFAGAERCAAAINRRRATLAKAALLLETTHAEELAGRVERLFGEIVLAAPKC